jgi:hypothetical protein
MRSAGAFRKLLTVRKRRYLAPRLQLPHGVGTHFENGKSLIGEASLGECYDPLWPQFFHDSGHRVVLSSAAAIFGGKFSRSARRVVRCTVNSLRIQRSFRSRDLAKAPRLPQAINSTRQVKPSCSWSHRLPALPTKIAATRLAWRKSFRISCAPPKPRLPS